MKKYWHRLSVFLLPLFLLSCNDEESNPVKSPSQLVAHAGDDKTVAVNAVVDIDGSSSYDRANKPFTMRWKFKTMPSGSKASLSEIDKYKTTFVPDKPGVYVIELELRQNGEAARDELIVTAVAQSEQPTTIILNEAIRTVTTLVDVIEDPNTPDYIVTTDLELWADVTINPGVVIYFADDKGMLVVEGSLKAIGTATKPITFTGYEKRPSYWKGVVFYSNSDRNELDHVEIMNAGSVAYSENGARAAVVLDGTPFSGAALKMKNTKVAHSGGLGLFVGGMSYLNSFGQNSFANNTLSAVYMPAAQLHTVDHHSTYTGNGFDGIETYGELAHEIEVTWKKLAGGSYLIANHLTIRSAVVVEAGASFKVNRQARIEITGDGSFHAVGTEKSPIVFLANVQDRRWSGFFFNTASERNKLHHVSIADAGFETIHGTKYPGNVTIGPAGKLSLRNSEIKNGAGYGLVAQTREQVNEDVVSANTFFGLALGLVYPSTIQHPDMPSVEGEWLDHWSFFNERTSVATDFYKDDGTWFQGASNPWVMTQGKGMGIFVDQDKTFRWAVAEQSPVTGCESYSAEFMTGTIQWDESTITFTQDQWRSKFVNSCDPTQNVDIDISVQVVQLPYEINKMYNVWTGEGYWELKFRNPDNSTFAFYRK